MCPMARANKKPKPAAIRRGGSVGSYCSGEESEANMILECLEESLLSSSTAGAWLFEHAVAQADRTNRPQSEILLR